MGGGPKGMYRGSVTMPSVSDLLDEWAAFWSSHDMDGVTALFTDDCTYEDVTLGVVNHGKEELRQFGSGFLAAMPDVEFRLNSKVAGQDRAALEWTMTGTQTGPLGDLPATGKSCTVRGSSVLELRNGLFSRCSDYWDMMTLLKQLGHVT